MSTLNVNKIADASGGVLAPISSVMRNRIINGAMVINQRAFSGSMTTAGDSLYTLDRWRGYFFLNDKYSVSQNAGSVTPPAGFTNYLGVTSSAATTVASGSYFMIRQTIEGYNIADLGWGTANAKTVTLSFWVRSSLTGTFGGSLENSAGTYSYPFSYTISSANTWEQKSITISGQTSGSWATNNTAGLIMQFSLGVGSSLQGTANTWANAEYWSVTGETQIVGTSGATWYVTGVQLEVGTQATGFEYRQYGQELALCQRYYETLGFGLLGVANSSTGIWAQMLFKVEKRATPTVGLFTTTQTWGQFGVSNRTSSSVSIGDSANTNNSGSITRIEGFSSMTANAPLGSLTSTVFTLSAEL